MRSIWTASGQISKRSGATNPSAFPTTLDYAEIMGLSHEARSRLEAVRPRTLGQAGRVEGVTAAALTILLAHLRKRSRTTPAKRAG